MVKELVVANQVVRLISGGEQLMLDACDGKRMIAGAKRVFSYIDPNFKKWGTNIIGRGTPEMRVAVYEIAKDTNFAKMFTSLYDDVSMLVLTQNQILNFIENHKNWLRQNDWATFFLFESWGEFLVADVLMCSSGNLMVIVRRFGDDNVWVADCRHRLVVPQL